LLVPPPGVGRESRRRCRSPVDCGGVLEGGRGWTCREEDTDWETTNEKPKRTRSPRRDCRGASQTGAERHGRTRDQGETITPKNHTQSTHTQKTRTPPHHTSSSSPSRRRRRRKREPHTH